MAVDAILPMLRYLLVFDMDLCPAHYPVSRCIRRRRFPQPNRPVFI